MYVGKRGSQERSQAWKRVIINKTWIGGKVQRNKKKNPKAVELGVFCENKSRSVVSTGTYMKLESLHLVGSLKERCWCSQVWIRSAEM